SAQIANLVGSPMGVSQAWLNIIAAVFIFMLAVMSTTFVGIVFDAVKGYVDTSIPIPPFSSASWLAHSGRPVSAGRTLVGAAAPAGVGDGSRECCRSDRTGWYAAARERFGCHAWSSPEPNGKPNVVGAAHRRKHLSHHPISFPDDDGCRGADEQQN